MTPPGYRITTDDPATFSDADVLLGAHLYNLFEEEVWPEDPTTPEADALAEHKAVPGRMRRTTVRAWDDAGVLAASADVSVDPENHDNPDVLGCWIYVHPDHRRRGLGTELLGRVVAHAAALGRTRIISPTFSRAPAGELFATNAGAKAKSWAKKNHLPTAEVDRSLMEAWVRDGPSRASGYELLWWDGDVPEEHLDAFVELMLVMNDAPRDDLELNDFTLTPEEWREGEGRGNAVGQQTWRLVARRKSDGALVGLHDLTWVPAFPAVMWIGSTGVRPEDRGHALGKWLKAAMMLRVLDERPEIHDIRTDNAESNEAMLSINLQMGYRELLAVTTWELKVG